MARVFPLFAFLLLGSLACHAAFADDGGTESESESNYQSSYTSSDDKSWDDDHHSKLSTETECRDKPTQTSGRCPSFQDNRYQYSSYQCLGSGASNDDLIVPASHSFRQVAGECSRHCASKGSSCTYFEFRIPQSTSDCVFDDVAQTAKYKTCFCATNDTQCATCSSGSKKYIGKPGQNPSCFGGDPHFVGARGTKFDFNGELGQSFCLLTDKSLHVNMLTDGYYADLGAGTMRSWIKAMAFLWKDDSGKQHEVVLRARKGKSEKRGGKGFISSITADGVTQEIPLEVGGSVVGAGGFLLTLKDKVVMQSHGLDRDVFTLSIQGILEAELLLNAEFPHLQAADDVEVHFNFHIYKIQTTPLVHGVLGQTYRPGVNRIVRAVEYSLLSKLMGSAVHVDGDSGSGFLDGHTSDYRTSSLTSGDCKYALAWNG